MDYDLGREYAKRRKDLFPLDLAPQGPNHEIFELWQPKIKAAKEWVCKKNPHPNLWTLSQGMAVLHLFASDIELETWKKLARDLCDFFGVKYSEEIPIKFYQEGA